MDLQESSGNTFWIRLMILSKCWFSCECGNEISACKMTGHFLTARITTNFSRRTLLNEDYYPWYIILPFLSDKWPGLYFTKAFEVGLQDDSQQPWQGIDKDTVSAGRTPWKPSSISPHRVIRSKQNKMTMLRMTTTTTPTHDRLPKDTWFSLRRFEHICQSDLA